MIRKLYKISNLVKVKFNRYYHGNQFRPLIQLNPFSVC